MATIKSIAQRLKSVKNIQKITKSMKMVSAAKYARAERELRKARPLGEGSMQFYIKSDIEKMEEAKGDAKPKKLLYIAVSSDRGLCGAVHTSVSRHIRNVLLKDAISRESAKIVCIGDKARSILQRLFPNNFLFVCTEVGRLPPTFLDASKIANQILKSDFEFDLGKIVYNRFRSVVSYVTNEITLFHVNTFLNNDKIMSYEETNPETVRSYVEISIAGLLYYALKEAACSEQSARMTAMDNASKNAEEMIGKLTLSYNRTRQAVITRELIEIISGASAL